jgi:hypothetical protein
VFSYKWKREKMRKGVVEKLRNQQWDAYTLRVAHPCGLALGKGGSWRALPAVLLHNMSRATLPRDWSSQCARLPCSRVPRCAEGGSALQEPVPRLVYVFVFEGEMCNRDLYAYFRPEVPELDCKLTCPCGWAGTRRGAQARKVFCQDADSRLPKP